MLLGLSLAVAACAGGGAAPQVGGDLSPAAEQPAGDSGPPPPAANMPQAIVLGALADDYVMEPNKSRFPNYNLHTGACEPLVRLSPTYEVIPWLATRWEYRGDNTFRFHLREGVTFHDGRPLTAEAVKWTFDRTARGNIGSSFIVTDSVKIVDDLTVDITPSRPNLRLVEQVVHSTYGVIAPGSELADEVICTGPWQLKEYVPHERVVLTRFEGYWGEKPPLSQITFRFFPDDNSRLLALQAGEIDFMMNLSREQVNLVRQTPGLKVVTAPVGRMMLLYLNRNSEEPHTILSDTAVRQAIGHALDRRTLIENVWEGNAAPVQLMAPPSILGPHAALVNGFTYDPDRARTLLEEAGWVDRDGDGIREKDGRRLSLTMIGWVEFDRTTFEFIQANLADAGIEMQIVPSPDSASYSAKLNAGEFDIDLEGPNQNDGNPMFLPALRFYSQANSPNAKYFAPGATFDAIVEAALDSADIEFVRQKSAEGMRLLIDEEAVVIPVAGLFRIYAMKENVHGFNPHPSWNNQWWDTLYFSER
jgi:peptide/nickel transport system substrate-binding protein